MRSETLALVKVLTIRQFTVGAKNRHAIGGKNGDIREKNGHQAVQKSLRRLCFVLSLPENVTPSQQGSAKRRFWAAPSVGNCAPGRHNCCPFQQA